jgi:serine/threonine protein kinase
MTTKWERSLRSATVVCHGNCLPRLVLTTIIAEVHHVCGPNGEKAIIKRVFQEDATHAIREAHVYDELERAGIRQHDITPRMLWHGPVHDAGDDGYAILIEDVGLDVNHLSRRYVDGQILTSHLMAIMYEVVSPPLSETRLPNHLTIRFFITQVSALQVLHAMGWVHRDIKPENIVIGPDGILRLIDLAFCKEWRLDPSKSPSFAGTFIWASPDALRGKRE